MRSRIRLVALVAVAALLLVPITPAQAKPPPKGKYECVIGSGSTLFGNIKILGGGQYKYSRFGKKGTFKAGKKKRSFSGGNVSGYSIRFIGGGLNKYKGYWFTSSTGTHEIALENPRDGFVSIYCDD